jgi:excisionase family DNA binding protein
MPSMFPVGSDCRSGRSQADDHSEAYDGRRPLEDSPERLLNVHQIAELLGVSKSTVLKRFESGALPGFRLWGRKGGPLRFRLSEIESLLNSWRVG